MRLGWKKSYQKVFSEKLAADVTGEEEAHLIEDDKRGRFGGVTSNIVAYVIGAFISFGFILGVSIYVFTVLNRQNSSTDDAPKRVCGNSAAEAVALGCTFDQMTWSWLSPKCPRYASDEFLAADDWKYFVDPYNRVQASSENWTMALDNKVPLYTERREHVSHCVYTFLSLAEIIRDGTTTHPRLSSYGHIKHCTMVVMESLKRDKDWYTVDADMGQVSFDEGC